MIKTPREWTMAAVCDNFENIVDLVISDGPQKITNSKQSVIIVAADDYLRLSASPKRQSLVQFFAESPLVNSGIDLSRSKE